MEDQEGVVGVSDVGIVVSSMTDGFDLEITSVRENGNLGDDLLEDLDSYLEDINDRLTISRMVSDSVIKGMVKAVEQVAAEKVASNELEVIGLKEKLNFHQLGFDTSQSTSMENGLFCGVSNDKWRESLCGMRSAAREQMKKLKKEMDGLRGGSLMKRVSSGSELVGLGGILQEKELFGVDKSLNTLKATMDTICEQVDDMVCLAKASVCEWQQEQEFQREVEARVIQSSIRSLHEEFEEKLRDQNPPEGINEILNLRKELDVILKSVGNPETGQQISHGSHEMDHVHHRTLSSHISPSTLVWEEKGIFEESENSVPENWDAAQLKHMTKDGLVNHFNNVITKMRRNHESKVQEMTEVYFGLKREYLKIKEKGSSLPVRKDKDLDMLRKKIPEVIIKLDDILVENGKFSTLSNNSESLGNLKDRINNLLSENHQLRVSLTEKRKEVNRLSLQVSDAFEKMLQQSLTEAKLLELIQNLKSAAGDAKVEASVSEEVYKCVLREVTAQINRDTKELEMESVATKEIDEIFNRKAAQIAEATSNYVIGDSDIESLIMQGLYGIIFREAIKEAQTQINDLNAKYLNENDIRDSVELEKENKSRLMIEEKERLKQEVLLLEASLKEKEKLALELSTALAREKERFELASQESNDLKDQASWQQTLVSEKSIELDIIKGELALALERIQVDKVETNKLNQKLELREKELREADEQRNILLAATKEKQNDILLLRENDIKQRKQMQVVILLVNGLSHALSDFEGRVAQSIKETDLRLEESSSQLRSLIQKASILKRTDVLYRQKLDRKCADLQLAEAEVDLLGDEVDALLSLLEKIYIALDHYSPVLKHYTGIIEILKLVRRELSGESTKPP
ncbi:WPP domain-associated protein-like [Actinidia eriantha]|uniref:WPP domain-associated protein-like n=1 Tax=Actinidia eriantha TaxID=165200 RepID=UPI00258B5ED2|nr:WPP domain-associated protein-like [Actinidia eriantha]XP_057463705.1 WPP domain-associated protein-like [Actinidia eriantha]XP_057463706.1 WPP domain-associated protein-like [Actinidia eriantha]